MRIIALINLLTIMATTTCVLSAPGIPQETLFIELNYTNDNGYFASIDALYTDKFSLRNNTRNRKSFL